MMKRTYTTRIHGVYGKIARVHLLKCACIYTLSADSRVSACPRLLRKSDDACYVKDVRYRESSRDRSGIRVDVVVVVVAVEARGGDILTKASRLK